MVTENESGGNSGKKESVVILTPDTIEKMAVGRDTAKEEIDSWLEFKKISQKKRDEYADNIGELVDFVEDGTLIVDEQMRFGHKLKFPIGNDKSIKQLIYVPRIKGSDIDRQLKGVKPTDTGGRVRGYVAALTGVAKGILADLDTEDYSVSQTIAVFFI